MNRLIIHVREPEEYAAGHVDGAINIPPDRLLLGTTLPVNTALDTQLILYCRTGSRSAVAKNILNEQGFTNVINGINRNHVEAKLLKEES